ncbi:MAG: hydrogenase 3 maturation endopeptidase HyCI [Anaerolineae bacterium]|nr:hydrogenase 3 maturation endopeptidase HyCI [Anaerolineae bacterium]
MCKLCWTVKLKQALNPGQRIAILGVGHELRGDDAAGVLVARELHTALPAHDNLLIIEAGPLPENHTGALRRFAPDVVVLVDAALMQAEAGAVNWIDWRIIAGGGPSTHTLPLHVFARYVEDEFGCTVHIIGIQPENNALLAELSEPVQMAVQSVVGEIVNWMGTPPV